MNVQKFGILNRALMNHREDLWVQGEPSTPRCEIEELKRAARRVTAPYTPKVHLLDHLLKEMERFGSIPLTDAARFEHFNVLARR